MIDSLNFIAWDLTARILFEVSVFFSLMYFILSIGQLIHIWWNHFHPSQDWGHQVSRNKFSRRSWQSIKESSFFKEMIIFGTLLLFLVLIFPLLHL